MYVRNGNLGRPGRLAGAHSVSSLRGLRGIRRTRRGPDLVGQRLAALGYIDPATGISYPDTPTDTDTSAINLSPTDASLISTGITTAGQIAVKALTPVPTVTYNPATGLYTSSGVVGASAAPGLGTLFASSSLSSYLPLLLLGGGLLVVVMMLKK